MDGYPKGFCLPCWREPKARHGFFTLNFFVLCFEHFSQFLKTAKYSPVASTLTINKKIFSSNTTRAQHLLRSGNCLVNWFVIYHESESGNDHATHTYTTHHYNSIAYMKASHFVLECESNADAPYIKNRISFLQENELHHHRLAQKITIGSVLQHANS